MKEANKSQAKPAIIMSLPVKKNLSQETGHNSSSALSLLKDSEIQAAKKTILTLDVSFYYLIYYIELYYVLYYILYYT